MEIPPSDLKKNEKFYIMVNLFIKKGAPDIWIDVDWRREKFACKKLVTKYGHFDFFYSLTHLQGKFNSLLGLMSKKFHNLDDLYFNYLLEKSRNVTYVLSEKPYIEIEQVTRKVQNIIEFLDN